MPKLKKYELHWEATVRGVQIVEAFDEQDAEEQFDSIIHEDGMPNEPVYADLDEVCEHKPKKSKK
jgi:hypothetical protein